MTKTIVSPKWKLILEDVKSWAWTNLLILWPIAATSLIEVLMSQDYGEDTKIIMLLLGGLLKLIQKLSSRSHYEA